MNFYLVASLMLLALVLMFAFKGFKKQRQQDSALKRRAIFNLNEQLTFQRLKETLPEASILAHVSFDALLTTKYPHTRHKYRNMMADFVVLNQQHQVMAIVALEEASSFKGTQQEHYQDALLKLAGYRVLRYGRVPEYPQLRGDFLQECLAGQLEITSMQPEGPTAKYQMYQPPKDKIFG